MVLSKVLDIKDVSKSYGDIEALKSASFVVPEGKVAGLVGLTGQSINWFIPLLGYYSNIPS